VIEQGVNPKLWLSVAAPLFESISTNERVGLKPTMITRPGSLAKPVAIALHHAKGRDGLNVSGLAGNPESTSHWVGLAISHLPIPVLAPVTTKVRFTTAFAMLL
jgi:hypothetical protein